MIQAHLKPRITKPLPPVAAAIRTTFAFQSSKSGQAETDRHPFRETARRSASVALPTMLCDYGNSPLQ